MLRAVSLYLADKASAPEKVEVINTTYTSIMLKWTAPRDTGRSKIISYHLKILQLNGTRSERSNNMTPTTDSVLKYSFYNLRMDTSYQISVFAYNKAGQGGVRTAIFKTPLLRLKAKGKMTVRHIVG